MTTNPQNWRFWAGRDGKSVINKRTLAILVVSLVLLPIAILLVVAVGGLLAAMQDAGGAAVLNRVALGLGILWAFGVVSLLLVLALHVLGGDDRPPP